MSFGIENTGINGDPLFAFGLFITFILDIT